MMTFRRYKKCEVCRAAVALLLRLLPAALRISIKTLRVTLLVFYVVFVSLTAILLDVEQAGPLLKLLSQFGTFVRGL